MVRPDKTTSKVRIVFDGSAQCNGVSLNDAIYQGPKLQRELFDVLLRFRKYPVALVCDIAEMYLQIEVTPKDRPYQRFLWRDLNQNKEPDEYEFTRVVFGINSSPFLAQLVAQKHAKDNENKLPLAAETVLKSTYMDDSLDSVLNEEQGVKLYHELSKLWESTEMHARKWLSNSPALLEHIPQEDRASEVDLDCDKLPSTKTLGIMWSAKDDIFSFNANLPENTTKWTKRNFLKKIAKLFDPLGFLTPYTIRAKVLLQEIWAQGVDWDELLSPELTAKASRWFTELADLENVKIPRCLLSKETRSVTLHAFVDSSELAYGGTVYVRCSDENGFISCNLVASKSKVAPLVATIIPRLELMGAVIGLRLTESISSALEIPMTQATFWTDSMNVLWWIKGCSRRYKPFVANRVGEIHNLREPAQWRHVPTNMNPADFLSRGMTVLELIDNEVWRKGPEFLTENETEWPARKVATIDDKIKELRKSVKNCDKADSRNDCQMNVTMLTTSTGDWRLNPLRFSSWRKLTRVRAWVNRFVENCQADKSQRALGELQADEIRNAEMQVIKNAQQEAFSGEYNALSRRQELPASSKLLALRPTLDEDGLLRSDGRLKYAEMLPYETRCPLILPRKHWVTKLIVKHYHEKGNHVAGTNHLLSELSARFWIISAREEIREWEKECAACKIRKAKAAKQIMAPLPKARLNMSLRAFDHIAVDFGGPFITVQGRGKRRQKRYLCLFTCLSTRAVHLELAFGLDTDSFLNAFYRMVNRLGLPTQVTSDNGKNMVGANNELIGLRNQLDQKKIASSTANQGIKWNFFPPLVPHFGGAHETMI